MLSPKDPYHDNASLLVKSLIFWRTKKQLIMSRSSFEIKYCALVVETCELQRLLYLTKDLQIWYIKHHVIYYDNLNALHITTNHICHERTKPLKIIYHLVRYKLKAKIMNILSYYILKTNHFIKSFLPRSFYILLYELEMIDIYHAPTSKGI